jgi:hypothetical protein
MIEARRRMLYASRYVYYRVGVYQDRAPLATTPREGQRGRPALPRHRQAFRSKPSDKARAEVLEGGSAMSGDNGPIPPIADPPQDRATPTLCRLWATADS